MDPVARTENGDPLWFNGECREPRVNEWYWTPDGPVKRLYWVRHRAWPILTKSPSLPDPYLAGRIDECLVREDGRTHATYRRLLKAARLHLGPLHIGP